jgi:serine/threonine protein kinase
MYLESQQKLHRDISYTNILLRSPGGDSTPNAAIRKKFIEALELSDIEELRKEMNCREGLLIDFDYAASMPEETSPEEGGAGDEVVLEGGDAVPTSTPNGCCPPNPSGARTVCFSNSKTNPQMLIKFAGDCSFHCA